MPATHLMRVDLPAPLSPTSAITSPERTSKSTSVSACTDPNVFERSRISRSGVSLTAGGHSETGSGGVPGTPPPSFQYDYLQYCLNSPEHTSLRLRKPSRKRRV